MSADKDVVKVTIKRRPSSWKLTVLKTPDGKKEPTVAFRASYESLGDALDGFEDWLRGVIIV